MPYWITGMTQQHFTLKNILTPQKEPESTNKYQKEPTKYSLKMTLQNNPHNLLPKMRPKMTKSTTLVEEYDLQLIVGVG